MKFKLNCSPHLKMHEITKTLFNNKFLSDIQFSIGGKVIYAHTLELMKRSVVFEVELEEMWGEQKLIPIVDCKYESFLEFLRYLYTDECTINDDNGVELLKLATKYKVIMLENLVINLMDTDEWDLQLFEHCVIDKYEIARRRTNETILFYFERYLKNVKFLSLHQDAVKEILQSEDVAVIVTEFQIFNALADWIQNYCQEHQMSLTEGRQRFDGLLRKIRFPVMSSEEVRECVTKYPGLLTESDCMSIGKQFLFGSDSVNDLWMSKQRNTKIFLVEWQNFNRDTSFETTFLVTKDTIFCGLWIGKEEGKQEIEIVIEAHDFKTKATDKIKFIQLATGYWSQMVISLGESLLLKPNFEYTITVKYLMTTAEQINVSCRKKDFDLIYNNPENSIKITKASDNMIEMFFKPPPL